MKNLVDYKDNIHSCSKCGLCQAVCPIYKITGNDCTVSRGHFIMLRAFIDGKLKMTKKINKYLNLCLKCGACTRFCPSEIDVVDIVAAAKAEYFNSNKLEQIISKFQKIFIFGLGIKALSLFNPKPISKSFDKKVLYFGGCGAECDKKLNESVVKLLNACGIEVIIPHFECCGIPFFVKGDKESFEYYMNSFFAILKKYGVNEIVTTCASCEKTLNSYKKYSENVDYKVNNIYSYLRENNLLLTLKNTVKVTFHKPCNLSNYDDIKWILESTKKLEYVPMQDYDKCCGFNGILNFKEYKILSNLFKEKKDNILNTKSKIVLTSCLGCEFALKIFSFGKYRVKDFIKFLGENVEQKKLI